MLAKNDITILKNCDYNIGKYLVALEAQQYGDKNVKDYEQLLSIDEKKLDIRVANLKKWLDATQEEQQTIILNKVLLYNNEITTITLELKEDNKHINEMVTTLNHLDFEGKLDRKHVNQNSVISAAIESIAANKEEIEIQQNLFTDVINISYKLEIAQHKKQLENEIENFTKRIVTHTANLELIKDREVWLEDTFKITKDEINETKKEYGFKLI